MTTSSCFSRRLTTAAVLSCCVLGSTWMPHEAQAQCTFVASTNSFTPNQYRCTDGAGFLWDLQSDRGDVAEGTRDAYDGFGNVCVTANLALTSPCNIVTETFSVPASAPMTLTTVPGGSEITLQSEVLGGLRVTRRLFVPHGGSAGYLRYLDVFENLGATDATVKIRAGTTDTSGSLGCDTLCSIVETNTGGTTLGPGLLWFVVDDGPSVGSSPAIAMVMDNAGRDPTSTVRVGGGTFGTPERVDWEYRDATVPAGGRIAYLHFQVQRDTAADAAAVARALMTPDAADLVGIDPTLLRDIRNFQFDPPPNCGDGVLQPAEGELCDDGNTISEDACTRFCVPNVCGDGFTDPAAEACDDGNGIDTDDCTNACELASCGDGIVWSGVEECDEGALNSDTEPDACRATLGGGCVAAFCTDGVLDTGEGCDDGNDIDDDGCSNACISAFCGDGVLQAGTGEECDDGNAVDEDECTAACLDAICGDGILQTGVEECDDGNADGADECTNGCTVAVCGDGVVARTEECDEGTANSDTDADACRTGCTAAGCGDAVIDTGESCDDGNASANDACNPLCQTSTCGDGFVWTAGGEACDDGAANGTTVGGCNGDCTGVVMAPPDMGAPGMSSPDMSSAGDLGVTPPSGGGGCAAGAGAGAGLAGLAALLLFGTRRRQYDR